MYGTLAEIFKSKCVRSLQVEYCNVCILGTQNARKLENIRVMMGPCRSFSCCFIVLGFVFWMLTLVFEIFSTFICSISSLRLVTSSLPLATAGSSSIIGTIATRVPLAVTFLLTLLLPLLPLFDAQIILLDAFLTYCLLFCDLNKDI